MPLAQRKRFDAYLLDQRARAVFDGIFTAAHLADDLQAFIRDPDTPAPSAEPNHKEESMATIDELAEQIEAALPADLHDKELHLSNGAILRLVRSRLPGAYCDVCQRDLQAGHQPACPQR